MVAFKNKYRNKITVIDGIKFHSLKEAKRYRDLKLLEKAKSISCLTLQPRYDMMINNIFCGFYKADFSYIENGVMVIEDVKGMRTPVYRIKKKIIEALYTITINEI